MKRVLSSLALTGLFAVLVHADPVNDIPKRTSEFKSYVSKVKAKLSPKAFANPAKRAEFDKSLAELGQQVGDFAKFADELGDGDLLSQAHATNARQSLGEGYMLLAESAWNGCDYQTVQETADLAKEVVAKDSDRTKLLFWKAMAQVRLVRMTDAEATCQELGKSGGAKAAGQVLALAKNKTGDSKPGKPITSFGFRGVAGEKVAVPEAHTGRVVLIDFWATWCGPCKDEMPNVIALYNELHEKGFDIVGISLDTDVESLKAYVAENKMPWPQYFDGLKWDNHISKYFGVKGIPHTILIDKTGSVKAVDLRGPDLDKEVRELLGIKK